MAYNQIISDRIREVLSEIERKVEEKEMFGGVVYMVDDKMCVGVVKDDLMCRLDPEAENDLLEKNINCRPMDFTKARMKGYLYVNEEGIKLKKDLLFWINKCLDYNLQIKAKPKKKK